MKRRLFYVSLFFVFLLAGMLTWSCSNSGSSTEQTQPAEEQTVTPTDAPAVEADDATIDTSAEQRPIIRQ